MKQTYIINVCKELAMKSFVKYKHGSIIVHSGKVVGHGFNTVCINAGYMHSCHAEISAIQSTNKKLLKTLIYMWLDYQEIQVI